MSCCYLCSLEGEEVANSDRWNFQFEGSDENFWVCRECHSQFPSVEKFDNFIKNETRLRLYDVVSRMKRLLALGAPDILISDSIKVIVGRAMRDDGISSSLEGNLKKVLGIGCIDTEDSNA